MLMCKATRSGGDHYTFKDSLNLSDYKVQDCSVGLGRAHSFMLVHVQVHVRTLLKVPKWRHKIRTVSHIDTLFVTFWY